MGLAQSHRLSAESDLGVMTVANQLGTNLGTISPEHRARAGSAADQKARRVNHIALSAESAKPPSRFKSGRRLHPSLSFHAKEVHRSSQEFHERRWTAPLRATDGKPSALDSLRRMSTVARENSGERRWTTASPESYGWQANSSMFLKISISATIEMCPCVHKVSMPRRLLATRVVLTGDGGLKYLLRSSNTAREEIWNISIHR